MYSIKKISLPESVRRHTGRAFSKWIIIQVPNSCTFILFRMHLRKRVIVLQIFLTKYVASFNECAVNF